ncbi:translation repressor protein [bacterium]|nr:translation repressor protein [Candidatus Elulimicrobium humile]
MINITDLVEVTLNQQDDFLKVRETLTRIGVASKKEKILYQSCHILHKQGKYYIVHFKELFALDGKPTDISENDLSRRNTIANLLQDWGLITLVDKKSTQTPEPIFLSQVKILSHKEKNEWQLIPKYNIGNKVKKDNF